MRYIPDISGLVKVENATFITVHDAKVKGTDVGPRLGILKLNGLEEQKHKKGAWLPPAFDVDYDPIEIHNWKGALPSDLEAICTIPNDNDHQNEFILAESSYYKGRFGRVFHVKIQKQGHRAFAQLLGQFKTDFTNPKDPKKWDEIEGIWCLKNEKTGKHYLIFANRGLAPRPAKLVWGELTKLNTKKPEFSKQRTTYEIAPALKLGTRGASTLYLKAVENGFEAWSVATIDEGDWGPFRSVIYQVGHFYWSRNDLKFKAEKKPITIPIEGLKIEGLADPAVVVVEKENKKTKKKYVEEVTLGFLSMASDDENYGGIWRPLFDPRIQIDPKTGKLIKRK